MIRIAGRIAPGARRAVLHCAAALALALVLVPAEGAAQGAGITFGTLGQDPNQPVEVTADSLSVSQSDGTAVFEGNVVVGQGEMKLSAQKVRVVYAGEANRIARLEASGGVTLVSGAEAAEAQEADYDIDAGTITLRGDVLLTQGENALTAQEMVVNLETGTAQMSGRVKTVLDAGRE